MVGKSRASSLPRSGALETSSGRPDTGRQHFRMDRPVIGVNAGALVGFHLIATRLGQVFNEGSTDASTSPTGLSPLDSILNNDRRLITSQMTDPHARLLSQARQRLSTRHLMALHAHLARKDPRPSGGPQGSGGGAEIPFKPEKPL